MARPEPEQSSVADEQKDSDFGTHKVTRSTIDSTLRDMIYRLRAATAVIDVTNST